MSRRPSLHYIPRMPAPPQAILAVSAACRCGEKPPPAPVVTLAAAHDTVQTTLSEVTTGAWLGGSPMGGAGASR